MADVSTFTKVSQSRHDSSLHLCKPMGIADAAPALPYTPRSEQWTNAQNVADSSVMSSEAPAGLPAVLHDYSESDPLLLSHSLTRSLSLYSRCHSPSPSRPPV